MSINTLLRKMVALKVIQWDLTDRILRGLSKCFIMQFSWLQCNLMYLSFLAFHNFSLHQFAAGSAGAGSPAGRRGGGGDRLLQSVIQTTHKYQYCIVCAKPPSTEKRQKTEVVDPYIPSFPLFQSADSERCIHLISQETKNWVWKTLEIISLLISSHLEIKDIV